MQKLLRPAQRLLPALGTLKLWGTQGLFFCVLEPSNSCSSNATLSPRSNKAVAEPEAAYGPPGSTGEENISVVVAPIQTGFKLESLGTAEQAGRRFLETTVASINANREAILLSAQSRYMLGQILCLTCKLWIHACMFGRAATKEVIAIGELCYRLTNYLQLMSRL